MQMQSSNRDFDKTFNDSGSCKNPAVDWRIIFCREDSLSSVRRADSSSLRSGLLKHYNIASGLQLSCLDLCDGIAPSFGLWHPLVRISRTFSRSPFSLMFLFMAFALFRGPSTVSMFIRVILALLCFLNTAHSGSSVIVCTGLIVTR